MAGGLAYCARRTRERGRRGRRSPVASAKKGAIRRSRHAPRRERRCLVCGGSDQALLYPANVSGPVPSEEFACTTPALGRHDDILACQTCGLISSAPRLSAEEILGGYESVVDEAYLEEETARRELFSWVTQAMRAYPVRGKRLLELGSNIGLFLDVARDAGWQARGIEPSTWAVDEGRRRFGVDLQQGTVDHLEISPGSVDAVVMLDVLEHLVDPMADLRRLRPALDDEGILVLATVNVESIHAKLRRSGWPWFIRSHLFYFSPQTLRAVLQRAGFRMVSWAVVPRSFHLSYLGARAGAAVPGLAPAAKAMSSVADPRIPVGWLGDVVLTIARPA